MKLPEKPPTLWPGMLLIAVAAAPWLSGCPAREPVPPTPVVDAGESPLPPPPEGGIRKAPTCAGWCDRAVELGCPAGKPTPNGSPCVAVCENVQRSGVVSWNLSCRVAATSCAAADACEAGK